MTALFVIARSEATKQSSFFNFRRKLDCFAALAMTIPTQESTPCNTVTSAAAA
jgi:hypothetical protein